MLQITDVLRLSRKIALVDYHPCIEKQLKQIEALIENHFKQCYKQSRCSIELNRSDFFHKRQPVAKKRPRMIIDGQYHYICIAPREWKIHESKELQQKMAESCLEHRRRTTCIHGAVTHISSVSTKLEYHNLKLWFKKLEDKSPVPNSTSYFGLLLNLKD